MGGREGGGGCWGAESGFFCTLKQKSSHCVFITVHKQPQFTCQANTVADSSLKPIVVLLVRPVASYTPQWTVMNLQGHKNDASESRPDYFKLCHWCVWIMLECGFHVKPLLGFQFLWECFGFL